MIVFVLVKSKLIVDLTSKKNEEVSCKILGALIAV